MIKWRIEVTEVGKKKLGGMRKWGNTKTLKAGSETITDIVKREEKHFKLKKIRLYLKSGWTITCQVLNLRVIFREFKWKKGSRVWHGPAHPDPSRDVSDHELGAFEVIRRNFWCAQMWISRTACWVSSTVMPSRTLHHLTKQLKQAFNHSKTYKASHVLGNQLWTLPGFLAPPYLSILPS